MDCTVIGVLSQVVLKAILRFLFLWELILFCNDILYFVVPCEDMSTL